MYPTRHAVQRYQQRVAPVSTAEAFRRLAELAPATSSHVNGRSLRDQVISESESFRRLCAQTRASESCRLWACTGSSTE